MSVVVVVAGPTENIKESVFHLFLRIFSLSAAVAKGTRENREEEKVK